MKKPVKKMDGGMMVGIPRGEAGGPGPAIRPMPKPGNRNMGRAMPMPNPKAREAASPNARFNRPGTTTTTPITGGSGMGGSTPVRSVATLPRVAVKKGGMPMRKAKGGMAKGKKK